MRGLNKLGAHDHSRDLAGLVRELPALSSLPGLSRFLGGALSVRQLRRRVLNRQLYAIRTSPRGSGRLLVPRGEVLRLLQQMAKQST